MDRFTPFKNNYKRYTYFSKESVEEGFTEVNFDNVSECKISKVGDIINNMYFHLKMTIIDYEFKSVDELYGTRYSEEYIQSFLIQNEEKMNTFINSISNLFEFEMYTEVINYLNIQVLLETIRNFRQDIENIENGNTSSLNNFLLNLEIVSNSFSNELEANTKTDYIITKEDLNVSDWEYFKLFHFIEYTQKIKELNLVKDIENNEKTKETKKTEFNRLEIHRLLDKKKKIELNREFYFKLCSVFSFHVGGNIVSEYTSEIFRFFSSYIKIVPEDMMKIEDNIIHLYFPILFFYNNMFPVICISYNELIIKVKLSDRNTIYNLFKDELKFCDVVFNDCVLYTEYIFLNSKERNLYKTRKNFLLVNTFEVIRKNLNSNDFTIVHLNFNNPSKFLYWYFEENLFSGKETFEFFFDHNNLCKKYNTNYFKYVQPWQKFNLFPESELNTFVYSFSLHPLEYQPSSLIDFREFTSKYMIVTNSKSEHINAISVGVRVAVMENGYFYILND